MDHYADAVVAGFAHGLLHIIPNLAAGHMPGVRALPALTHLTERHVPVGRKLTRHAQDTLADEAAATRLAPISGPGDTRRPISSATMQASTSPRQRHLLLEEFPGRSSEQLLVRSEVEVHPVISCGAAGPVADVGGSSARERAGSLLLQVLYYLTGQVNRLNPSESRV
jgi:hypothetical protein